MFKYLGLLLVVESVFCGNLVEVLKTDGESKLIKYVTAAGLADAILAGTYTIFAPTDAAFDAVGTEAELLKDTNALADILKYHVVKGVIPSSAAKNELQLETLAGTKIRFNIYTHNHHNTVTVEGSRITKFDLSASNGVVHVINKVMTPPTGSIVDLVAGNSDFSTLLAQVKSAGLVNALQGDGLTVFAPTNAAFAKLGSNLIHKITTNKALLTEILEYHVVPHTEYAAGLYSRERLPTIDKHHDTLRIHKSGRTVGINTAHVTKADLPASNGVVHVIDHVLIPARYLISLGFGRK